MDASESSTGSTLPGGSPPGAERNQRSRTVVRIAWLLVVVASIILIGHALLTPAAPTKQVTNAESTPLPPAGIVGHLAPNVTLVDLAGHSVTVASYRSQVLVLNFWYVACEPCRYEMPIFERIYHADHGESVTIVGVNIADDAPTIATFTHTLGIDYPILRDATQQAVTGYGVTVTPTTFVIDQRGVIRAKFTGAITDSATLDQAIEPLITAK